MVARHSAEGQQHKFFRLIGNAHFFPSFERFLLPYGLFRQFAGRPRRKIGVYHLHGLLKINIARYENGHIVRLVPGAVKVEQSFDGRIFQVFHMPQGWLLAVRMLLEEHGIDGVLDDAVFVVQCPVHLLVHRFQFSLKETEHRTGEAVGLQRSPLFQAVDGQVNFVDHLLVPRMGVQAASAHGTIHPVKFVGHGVGGRQSGFAGNLFIKRTPLFRIGLDKVLFIQFADAVEMHLFLFIVQGAQALRTLEQPMLHVMGEARCFRRVVLAPGTHRNLRIETGRIPVHRKIHFQTIVQFVNARLQRVVWIRPAHVVKASHSRPGKQQDKPRQPGKSYLISFM